MSDAGAAVDGPATVRRCTGASGQQRDDLQRALHGSLPGIRLFGKAEGGGSAPVLGQ